MKARSIPVPYILATVCHFVYKPSSAFHVHRLAVMTSLKQSGAFAVASWSPDDASDAKQVKEDLKVWPLDEYNVKLLNEVHPKSWEASGEKDEDGYYDFIAIGAGAGGLVSSRQAARRGAKSAMISSNLAGGDCLNVGCVPSKALIRCARMIREVRKAKNEEEFGVKISGEVEVDFAQIMRRMRKLRAEIAPIDGHARGEEIGVHVYQGFGRFVSPDTIEIRDAGKDPVQLKFRKAAICTGGRAKIPGDIDGLKEAPFTTNETLFNLSKLPSHIVVLGSGVVSLEMAQTFATFGSKVTVLVRGEQLFPRSDPDAGKLIQEALNENSGVEFLTKSKITKVQTIKHAEDEGDLPLMKISIDQGGNALDIESDCLLIAAGRLPNVENLNLEAANVEYDADRGVIVDDQSKSISNSNVFSVGDCTAGVPRLTHMSGEMAKVVIQNALFDDDWKLSSLVVPSCMYTEPEFASVGILNAPTDEVDVWTASLEHNDRAILDSDNDGYVKIFCKKGTGTIIGCSIIGSRAGELINEVTLAMKNGIPLENIGRNIHCYPTTGEAIMGCGIQLINSKWKLLN